MFTITVLAVGKIKEDFYRTAVEEYGKRLQGYCCLQLTQLPETRLPKEPSAAQIAAGLAKEGELIRAHLPKNAWFCVLTPEGKQMSSPGLAQTLAQVKTGGYSGACFLLGSSYGIAPEIKAMADLRLSFSPMTFPHHLARVMLMEQLYRAESLQAGGKYHK